MAITEQHVLTQRGPDIAAGALGSFAQGNSVGASDPVRTSPLFVNKNLKRYTLKLDSTRQQGDETFYVLSFAAKRADHTSTGTYQMGVYQGRLLVRQRDYVVLHYEAFWQLDTATYNGVARKNAGKQTLVAHLYSRTFTNDRTTHVVDYSKAENGRYFVRRSIGQTLSTGRTPGKGPFYYQSFTERYFKLLPTPGPPPPPVKANANPVSLPAVPYRPEFWDKYQRPGGALVAPVTKR
jgi:hypothetical protein